MTTYGTMSQLLTTGGVAAFPCFMCLFLVVSAHIYRKKKKKIITSVPASLAD